MAIPVKDGKREDFDYFYCKGCGICFKVCPFQAISFEKETHQEVNGDGNP
jgi:pyruvate ferredoxin/flavodoxin oxidoreductase, delta subunit